ncbi:MAG: S1/P1 Nuclease [Candidatus Eremiobacteraeota bacterium]|nr:S1/P1 Nuclease [Candidatus Eremiobacteraeota bacterium]
MLRRTSSLALLLAAATAGPASAWGGVGHTMISRAGARAFPATLPAFVRTDAAVDEIASLGPELDRSKDAGATHDRDLDTGHYLDIGDDGKVFGVVDLSALPATREAYDSALRGAGSDEYKAGYLPYALIDGWQQIAKDFAIWRIDDAALKSSSTQDRAWFTADRALRETLTLRDIGIWSHYVGDASQPLHITVHFNGWGAYPNPNGYSQSHTLHADFETRFVDAHATLDAVTAAMAPVRPSTAPIATLVGTYLAASASHVVPLYDLDKAGAFANATPDAVTFVDARLADGAAEFRDLVVDAWHASDTVKVGYPHAITPADVESGTVMPTRALAGAAD